MRKLAERNVLAARGGNQHTSELVWVVTQLRLVAQVDGVAFEALDGVGDVHAADGGHDHVLNIPHGQTVARGLPTVDDEVQVVSTEGLVGIRGERSRKCFHHLGYLLGDLLQRDEVGAGDLDPDGGPDPGGEHVEADLDRPFHAGVC